MAYTSNDKQEDFGKFEIDSAGNYIHVTKITPDKESRSKSIDIREFYTDKKDNNIYPTKKGVRIKYDFIVEVMTAVLNAVEPDVFNAIMDNFKDEEVDESHE